MFAAMTNATHGTGQFKGEGARLPVRRQDDIQPAKMHIKGQGSSYRKG